MGLWRGGCKPDYGERGHLDCDRMRKSMPRNRGCFDAAHVADVRPAVRGRIRVEDFAVPPGTRHPDPQSGARHRREIADAYDAAAAGGRYPHEYDQVARCVFGFNPAGTGKIGVSLPY